MKVRITVGEVALEGELNDSPTAKKVYKILPISTGFSTWGDEIYFSIPVKAALDDTAREEVEMGDLGFWPQGNAFCIFFGPTPMSSEGRIIPASAVNIIGRVTDNVKALKGVMGEAEIRVESA